MSSKLSGGFVLCVSSEPGDDIEAWKVYRSIADPKAAEVGCLRVIDESGEDYLYSAHRFVPIELPASAQERLLAATR